jgi:hypothetical protein
VTSQFTFILVCYSIAFLIADASIFGCGTVAYNEDPDDKDYIWSHGILKIRPYFLHTHFFRELFTCYFCLGIWIGPVAHTLMYYALGDQYWLFHENTPSAWVLNAVVASLVSATSCYSVNTAIDKLEGPGALPPLPPPPKELPRGDSENDR